MIPQVTLRKALQDGNLLGASLPGSTWDAWRALLLSIMGEELTAAELETFQRLTKRQKPPLRRVRHFYAAVGRRGGKSKAMATLAAYLGALCKHEALTPGEKGVILVVAADQKQASVILNYCAATLEQSPVLKKQVIRQTADTIELAGGVAIEVRAASFRRLRGVTCICAICDELAFWISDEYSSNPDYEIINALKPSLLTTSGMLIGVSSPYSRRGVLWDNYSQFFGQEDDGVLVAQGASRDLNPSLPQEEIDAEYEKDSAYASAEYGGQFRSDLESFVSAEVVDACTDIGEFERPYYSHFGYCAFVDPSGGSSDSMTLGIAHVEENMAVLDLIEEVRPPFSPRDVVEQFAERMKAYKINRCFGDRYGSGWVTEQFQLNGIDYLPAEQTKSDLYGSFLPMMNSRTVALVDNQRLRQQLLGLERRTGRAGRDTIDHGRGAHDDVANAVAGCLVLAKLEPAVAGGVPGFNRTIEYPKWSVA